MLNIFFIPKIANVSFKMLALHSSRSAGFNQVNIYQVYSCVNAPNYVTPVTSSYSGSCKSMKGPLCLSWPVNMRTQAVVLMYVSVPW